MITVHEGYNQRIPLAEPWQDLDMRRITINHVGREFLVFA
jgi:hypothetical protein